MFRFFFVFLFCVFISTYSQTIKGRVVDVNEQPLMGATVYIDGSTIGTTTNKLGFFELDYKKATTSDLVISYIGYTTLYLNKPKINTDYKFVLKEEVGTLNEVTLTQNPFSRKQMLAAFIRNFLGTTRAGKKCKILNLDDVYFNYDRTKLTLVAFSDSPLTVVNPYLGYTVYYNLQRFEIKYNYFSLNDDAIRQMIYGGTTRFVETNNSKKILKRRSKVFEGSVTQFFRNISNNKWGKEHFYLFKGSFMINPAMHLKVADSLDFNYVSVKNQSPIENTFFSKFNLLDSNKNQSAVQFRTPYFFIDKYGVFSNYESIFFNGYMSKKKVGDMLPNNYGL